jgi:catechol 2,3-dioxygenase-like lactoylglutathione lyase family enzyme
MSRLLCVNPTLRARDVLALAHWYRDQLGFEVNFLWQDPPTHAVIGRDEIRVGIAPRDTNFGPASFYQHVEGIDGLHAEFLARGVPLSGPPTITPYQMKEFEVHDPDGNRICFGEHTEASVNGKASSD